MEQPQIVDPTEKGASGRRDEVCQRAGLLSKEAGATLASSGASKHAKSKAGSTLGKG